MNEQVCRHCGKTRSEHLLGYRSLVCEVTTFEPKPEPMKAKPGVCYTNRYLCIPLTPIMVGTTKGDLVRIAGSPEGATERVAMSSDWLEVPE